MLYCPNPTCQAPNPVDQQVCQKCATPLPHRYLWAIGEGALTYQPGDLVGDRYWCQRSRVFLDTKPGFLSNTYRELPEAFVPYLRLAAHPLHVPQIYDWLPAGGLIMAELVLLDQVPLYEDRAHEDRAHEDRAHEDEAHEDEAQGASLAAPQEPADRIATSTAKGFSPSIQLLPTLDSQWQQVSPLRQMNWLWQMANLWDSLSNEAAVGSFFEPDLLRVEGTLLRLLELRFESKQSGLRDLGQLWLGWAKTAHPAVAQFITLLAQDLIQGEIYNTELLIGHLDQALARLSQAQTRSIQLATLSDQGPTRQRNEDACYPPSGTRIPPASEKSAALSNPASPDPTLLIVCDGIGGHQGGDVASHLAITTLEQRLTALDVSQLDPVTLAIELEKATCAANDQISERNDSEQRFDRQRMGTTLVMALARDHELYITHVGDSRAYWITRWGCHQITLDDDVASREVRLGYSFYRQALHQPSAGSLVQALGMGASTLLYPNVQRLIPDEDCVLLLCSDGLSDNDRVEESWHEIIQLLDGKVDLATLSQRLVEVGNTCNGYDNVTVGLIHYQVNFTQPIPVLTELLPIPQLTRPASSATPSGEEAKTEVVSPVREMAVLTAPPALPANFSPPTSPAAPAPATKIRIAPLLTGIGLLCGLVGLLIGLWPVLRPQPSSLTNPLELPSEPASSPSPVQPQPSVAPASPALTSLEVGTRVRLSQSPQNLDQTPVLTSRPPQPQAVPNAVPVPNSPSPNPPSPTAVPPSPTASQLDSQLDSQVDSQLEPIQPVGFIPIGSVLEVVQKRRLSQQESWVELQVCSTSAGESPESPLPSSLGAGGSPAPGSPPPAAPSPDLLPIAQPGQTGWIEESILLTQVTVPTQLTAEQQQGCS